MKFIMCVQEEFVHLEPKRNPRALSQSKIELSDQI